MKYEIIYERTEVRREVFTVEADNEFQAISKASELCDAHDWTDNELLHGDTNLVAARKVPE